MWPRKLIVCQLYRQRKLEKALRQRQSMMLDQNLKNGGPGGQDPMLPTFPGETDVVSYSTQSGPSSQFVKTGSVSNHMKRAIQFKMNANQMGLDILF